MHRLCSLGQLRLGGPSGEVLLAGRRKELVPLGVFTHISLLARRAERAALLEALVARARTTFGGRLAVGEDLMTIVIGDSSIVR